MIDTLKRLHSKLIGHPDDTPIQARIFHEVSIIAMIGLPMALLVNFFINVPLANVAMGSTWVLIAGLYINSRYFSNLRWSVIIFTIGSSVLIAFNYFINSGVNGPTLLLYLLSLVFILSVMPGRQYLLWLPFNLGIVVVLLLVEYDHPELVGISYVNRSDLFIDMATTYIGVIGCISVVLSYLIKNYQREQNNALRASIALKAGNDSKTRLLSILSHDLRSPLNSIQGFLEILLENDLSQDDRQSMEKALLNETKNTQVMLDNLLNWSKSQMESGTKVNLTRVNLQQAVNAALGVLETVAREKNISVSCTVDSTIHIIADLDMLKLVIRNLINNAIKFTPVGGQIIIYCSVGEEFVQLHVQDNGLGIPAERQQNLFGADSASTYGTNNEKGVGLGLMLCREFTALQGGQISFSSIPDRGTTFTLEFAIS